MFNADELSQSSSLIAHRVDDSISRYGNRYVIARLPKCTSRNEVADEAIVFAGFDFGGVRM